MPTATESGPDLRRPTRRPNSLDRPRHSHSRWTGRRGPVTVTNSDPTGLACQAGGDPCNKNPTNPNAPVMPNAPGNGGGGSSDNPRQDRIDAILKNKGLRASDDPASQWLQWSMQSMVTGLPVITDSTGVVCFGRAACEAAYRYIIAHPNDLAGAVSIAANYCSDDPGACRNFNVIAEIGRSLLGLGEMGASLNLAGDEIPATTMPNSDLATIVGPGGTVLPGIEMGAGGVPTAVDGKLTGGMEFPIDPSGSVLSSRVASIRVMMPSSNWKYPMPNGYVSYQNAAGQTIDPLSGQTVSNSDPWAHIQFP